MKIKSEIILRRIGSDIILVPVGSAIKDHNGLFMLTESACFLWENLSECDSVQELADKLYDEYEVTREQALADTEEFINKLINLDIIEM